jgi:UDP-N-acetylglucosamine--N-acetylmuramyl-(pentapeptide) pyrophosphoryl-undecaprenol N-acetylglucosamine transferase
MRRLKPNVEILFIGSGRPLEKKLIDENGFERKVIDTVGISRRGVKGLWQFCTKLPKTILQSRENLKTFKPDLVIGFGGYVSVIPILIASFSRIKTAIHEAESHAGLSNWLLSFFVNRITLAWSNAKIPGKSKQIVTGHPLDERFYQYEYGEKRVEPLKILVLGGSQGAAKIDELMLQVDFPPGCQITHQARPENVERIKDGYLKKGVIAEVKSFIDNMAETLYHHNLVVARAGAGTVRELNFTKRKAILFPLPLSPEQYANAIWLKESNQAVILDEFASDAHLRLKGALLENQKPPKSATLIVEALFSIV